MKFNSQIVSLILFAIAIRILIMPFFFHPDIKTYHFQSSFLKQGVFNIYEYLSVRKNELPLKEEFIYFPLTYFFLGSYQGLISPLLGPDFNSWISNADQNTNKTFETYRYLFLLKFPYLIMEFLIIFFLLKLADNQVVKRRLLLFSLFNPASIFIIYVFSNVDVFPVLFVLLSLLSLSKKQYFLSGIFLGIGAGFKAYPLVLLPFFVLAAPQIKQRISLILGSLGLSLLIILPFLNSQSFRESTLTSGLVTRLLNASIGLGFGESIIVGVVALSLLFYNGWVNGVNINNLWKYLTSAFLLLFSFIHFHIQWILWVIPFIGLIYAYNYKIKNAVLSLCGLLTFIPLLYEDKFMTFGLLQPISEVYSLIPIPFGILQKIYDPFVFTSIMHSLLIGGSILVVFSLINQKNIE